jgi:catechol 2,3-dioxygenase-like lactoylglutathione lyase family enzyme
MQAVFDHVSLTVTDTSRSIEFYARCLGFKLARRDKPNSGSHVDALTDLAGSNVLAAFVTNGTLTLEFVEFGHPRAAQTVCAPMNAVGSPHLGFVVKDVRAEYERLKELGVKFIAPPVVNPHRGTYSVMLRDPDGIPIELRESPAVRPGSVTP